MVVLCGLPVGSVAQGFLATGAAATLGNIPFAHPGVTQCSGSPRSGLLSMPSLYFGWLEHPTGSNWALQRQASTGTAPWPLKGWWFEATKEVPLDQGYSLLISGGVFLPRRTSGTWVTSPLTRSFDFEIPSYDWWFVDGLAKCWVSGPLELLVGLRWDHTSTRVDYSDNTSDDYILNSYLPLIGAQINQPFCNGSMLVRFVAAPLVWGQIKYHFWDRLGYAEFGDFRVNSKSSFVEILADYRFKLTGDLQAGAFAKWNSLRVRTDDQNLSGLTTESVSWAVDIRSWTLGAVASFDFSSPL
jgi:hypothetical protein